MNRDQTLSASQEDYLEAIYHALDAEGRARAKDVARHLGVAASSVTNALRGLVSRGLVTHAPYEAIRLTEAGQARAHQVVQRHQVLSDFFLDVLSLDDDEASRCACRMEHAVSDVVLERLVKFIEYEKRCSRGRTRWVDGHGFMCQSQREVASCSGCGAEGGGRVASAASADESISGV
jgi:DtxR family Mn-dependent transcriptional regulator